MSEHPNVTLVRRMFSKSNGVEDENIGLTDYHDEGGSWDTLWSDDIEWCGTSGT